MIEDRMGLTCRENALKFTQYLKIKRLMKEGERVKGETV
jgi:hypothetical protein